MDGNIEKLANDSGPVERPLIDAAWAQFESLAAARKPPSTGASRSFAVPGYRVLREIHRGGQGVVYQAMQESTRRKVAIKVLKQGPLADEAELARFDREVDVLSRLKHPHIVAIHDRGSTAGHAYYVMDYIPGRPLDVHVAGAPLSRREVLELFHKICEAVNVAHLRGVIHRDLKPSNIRVDEEGEPHVLDFGLAKLAHDPGSPAEAMTVTGQFIGSLPWSSPEQAEARSDLLDVRTDVYSLGVILYQLLTRRFPYPVTGRMDDVVRNILHTSPARPSTIAREIDRDVEVILLKCLAKDPERRYQSAGDLARDLQRFLNGEPIEARRATSLYQFRQFARRNKALVTSVVAIIFILAAATAVSVAFGLSATRQRQAAESARARAEKAEAETKTRANELEAVATFQEAQLSGIDAQTMGVRLRASLLEKARMAAGSSNLPPAEADARVAALERLIAGSDFTGMALESLATNFFQPALAAVHSEFAAQPLVQARLLQTLATTMLKLGMGDMPIAPQEEALAIRRRELGNEHPDTLYSVNELGLMRLGRGRLTEAEVYLREALQGFRQLRGDEDPDTLKALNNLGQLLEEQGNLAGAEANYREAAEKLRRVRGNDHPETLTTLSNLGMVLLNESRPAEAEPYLQEALDSRRRVLGSENLDTLISMNNMGILLQAQGKPEEAEVHFRESLEKHRRTLGDEHPNTLTAISSLGFALRRQGRLAEAEPYYREALEKQRRLLGDDHSFTISSMNNMGYLLQAQGKLAEAELYCREALERWRRLHGDEHPDTLIAINNLGLVLLTQGRLSEAEPFCREGLEGRRRVRGEEHSETLISITNMGSLLQAQGKAAEAIELMAPAEPAVRRTFAGGNAIRVGRLLTALGRARAALGQFDAAEACLSEARQIVAAGQGATQRDHTDVLTGLVELFEARHAAEPDKGYDGKAAEWRTRLRESPSVP